MHTQGWPLSKGSAGGSWMYHLDNNQISVGFVVNLDYENPYLSPFEEFQRFKLHPSIKSYFKMGKEFHMVHVQLMKAVYNLSQN